MMAGKTGRLGGLTIGLSVFTVYYMLLVYGENLVRAGKVSHYIGAWSPTADSRYCCFIAFQERMSSMRIIQRYFIKEFFKILGILALGLALIFSLLDLIDKIDDFMPGKPSIPIHLCSMPLLNFPKYLYYLLPMSLLDMQSVCFQSGIAQ